MGFFRKSRERGKIMEKKGKEKEPERKKKRGQIVEKEEKGAKRNIYNTYIYIYLYRQSTFHIHMFAKVNEG